MYRSLCKLFERVSGIRWDLELIFQNFGGGEGFIGSGDSETVSGIGLVLELIFQNGNEDFLSSQTPRNRNKIVWKSREILFWNFRGDLVIVQFRSTIT